MISKIFTYSNTGLHGQVVTVEIDSSKSVPQIEIIGLPDTAVKESKERIRSVFRNCNIELPNRKFILNLAPSDLRKNGTTFDLPMAVWLLFLIHRDLSHTDQIDKTLFFGELWLDGQVKRVNGLLPSVVSAMKQWYVRFFVPADNVYELEYIRNIQIYPISHFSQIIDHFVNWQTLIYSQDTKNLSDLIADTSSYTHDFAHIKWQIVAKRACTVAAAGLHNMILVWAPGSGKTMLAKSLMSIMPPLHFRDILECSEIYSLIGKLSKDMPLITSRPFRPVHHTASKVSIIWGSSNLTPGEVSLAHHGVLFFDELTEFPREVLEVLRQPLEDKVITISRVSGSVQYPAQFMFVAAMNPCKCGYYKDPIKPCTCNIYDIKKYQSKISGPLLDRIDMILEIPREDIEQIMSRESSESSEQLRSKVMKAREIQQHRFANTNITSNSQITAKDIQQMIIMDTKAEDLIKQWAKRFNLSGRVVHRIIKLARTIADMDGQDQIGANHIAESLQYRSKTMFVEEM